MGQPSAFREPVYSRHLLKDYGPMCLLVLEIENTFITLAVPSLQRLIVYSIEEYSFTNL